MRNYPTMDTLLEEGRIEELRLALNYFYLGKGYSNIDLDVELDRIVRDRKPDSLCYTFHFDSDAIFFIFRYNGKYIGQLIVEGATYSTVDVITNNKRYWIERGKLQIKEVDWRYERTQHDTEGGIYKNNKTRYWISNKHQLIAKLD